MIHRQLHSFIKCQKKTIGERYKQLDEENQWHNEMELYLNQIY